MGGVPPLGYDVDNRLLVINETEAAVVRRIFEEMLTIGSPTQIAAKLTAEGVTTKAWTTQEGQTRSGTRIDKKYLHKLLRNRIYLGELSHKGNWFSGAHSAIIDRGLFARHDLGQGIGVKSGDVQVEAVFLQRLQFDTQHVVVPASVFCDAVVRNDERSALGGRQVIEHDHGHGVQAQLLRSGQPSVTGDDHAIRPRQDRIGETELDDGGGNLCHLPLGMGAGVSGVGHEFLGGPALDMGG